MAENSELKNILSYQNIISDVLKFQGRDKSNYNKFDEPRYVYFKPIFYFNNPSDNNPTEITSNLLGLEITNKDVIKVDTDDKIYLKTNWKSSMNEPAGYSKNTAYNYLKLNNELERAEYLKDFILLLSEISSNSPWYFQEITGLESAITKPFFKDLEIKDERRSINIKCLPDAFDTRIGTLIDLYKAACYSNVMKKEVIPANLRKFDMGIYIFSIPYKAIHTELKSVVVNPPANTESIDTNIKGVVGAADINMSSYFTGCKYIELLNCEIDLESGKDAFNSFTNNESKQQEYNLIINYSEAMESNYNEFLMNSIGDFVALDLIDIYGSDSVKNASFQNSAYLRSKTSPISSKLVSLGEYGKYAAKYKKPNDFDEYNGKNNTYNILGIAEGHKGSSSHNEGFLEGIVNDLIGAGSKWVDNKLTSLFLGNAHGLSINDILHGTSAAMDGNVFATISAIQDQVDGIGNIMEKQNYDNNGQSLGDAHTLNGFKKINSVVNQNAHKLNSRNIQ